MPTPYQGRRRTSLGATAQHREALRTSRHLLGAVSAVVIAAAAALVAQALPASPLARTTGSTSAASGSSVSSSIVASTQQAARGIPVGAAANVSGVVGQLPASSLRLTAVSRDQERLALPGCDGQAPNHAYANGQIPVSELCALPWAPAQRLRADAALSLAKLDQLYAEVFNDDLCISDTYRTIGSQFALAARKPRLAARPGSSEHGWGVAVDFCGKGYSDGTSEHDWLLANARRFGWDNPGWARADGAKPEPWHWEYVASRVTRSSAKHSG